MVELKDTVDLGSTAERHTGLTPVTDTNALMVKLVNTRCLNCLASGLVDSTSTESTVLHK